MNQNDIFDFQDLISGSLWLIIILAITFFIKLKNQSDKPYYSYFFPVVLFKILFGLFFGYTYVEILGYGGDTVAYWEGAVKLNQLFFESPAAYFDEMLSTPSRETIGRNFNMISGYPPGWIYIEPESFFVSKIVSLFTFFTFNSFTALTIIFAFFSALASFKLFELVRNYAINKESFIAFVVLFIPTVSFWCSGVSKDTLLLISLFYIVYYLFKIFLPSEKFTFKTVLSAFLFILLAYHIRPFMIIAIFLPLLFAFGFGFLGKVKSKLIEVSLKFITIFLAIGVLIFSFYIGYIPFGESYLEEVAIIQQDFAANKTYGGPRYELTIIDYTPLGMLLAGPESVLTALYRPFIWEAQGPILLLSGVESVILIFLTLKFIISKNVVKKWRFIINNEFLLFCLLFALIFGFFVGFSAGLFNVLVRFKAPLLVFFVIVLIANPVYHKKNFRIK